MIPLKDSLKLAKSDMVLELACSANPSVNKRVVRVQLVVSDPVERVGVPIYYFYWQESRLRAKLGLLIPKINILQSRPDTALRSSQKAA